MGAKLFHMDGQIDMTKSLVAFRNFAVAPKTAVFIRKIHVWFGSSRKRLNLWYKVGTSCSVRDELYTERTTCEQREREREREQLGVR